MPAVPSNQSLPGTGTMDNPFGGVKPVLVLGEDVSNDGEYSLADVDPIGRIEVIIYGPPGSGKTVMAGTFPGPFRWLAADGDTALKSLRWAFKAGKMSITRLQDVVAFSPKEAYLSGRFVDKPNAFNVMTDRLDKWFKSPEVDTWQTLVIDSATEVNEWALNMGLSLNVQLPTVAKPLSSSHTVNKKALARIVTGQQDYKSAMALFEGWLGDVRARCAEHGKNLIIICHVWTDENEDGQVLSYQPLLLGQLRTRVGKAFDDIWFMQVYNGKDFKAQVHSDPRVQAKTRWGQVLSKEEPADFREMIKKVKLFHGL